MPEDTPEWKECIVFQARVSAILQNQQRRIRPVSIRGNFLQVSPRYRHLQQPDRGNPAYSAVHYKVPKLIHALLLVQRQFHKAASEGHQRGAPPRVQYFDDAILQRRVAPDSLQPPEGNAALQQHLFLTDPKLRQPILRIHKKLRVKNKRLRSDVQDFV